MNTKLKYIYLASALSCGLVANVQAASVLDFAASTTSSTLDQTGAGEIRWDNITTFGGGSVDLVATVIGGTYAAANLANNGLGGNLGQINAASATNFDILFSFVDSTTGAAVTLTCFTLGLYDTDANNNGSGQETVTFLDAGSGTATYATTSSTALTIGGTAAQPSFTQTNPIAVTNPTDGSVLTNAQEDLSVIFEFANTDSFSLNFDTAAANGGRNFLFSGDPVFDQETDVVSVPEPSQSALLLVGLGALALKRRRS